MKFSVLEFEADFKNRIFYALNIMYRYHFIFISNFTHVAALLFELLLSSQSALSYSRENGGSAYMKYLPY